jgi:hypothetical protein
LQRINQWVAHKVPYIPCHASLLLILLPLLLIVDYRLKSWRRLDLAILLAFMFNQNMTECLFVKNLILVLIAQ